MYKSWNPDVGGWGSSQNKNAISFLQLHQNLIYSIYWDFSWKEKKIDRNPKFRYIPLGYTYLLKKIKK